MRVRVRVREEKRQKHKRRVFLNLVSSNPHCKTDSQRDSRIILCSHASYPSPFRCARNHRSPGTSLSNLSYFSGGKNSLAPTRRLSFAACAEQPVAKMDSAANSNSADFPLPRPDPLNRHSNRLCSFSIFIYQHRRFPITLIRHR